MNPSTKSSLSLYQLVQNINPPPKAISVSPTTVQSCVAMVLELLIEQQLPAKIWLKLPQTKSWHQQVRKYHDIKAMRHVLNDSGWAMPLGWYMIFL